MTGQGMVNIVAAIVGVGIMLAFHFHSRKKRALTPGRRIQMRKNRERWLYGAGIGFATIENRVRITNP